MQLIYSVINRVQRLLNEIYERYFWWLRFLNMRPVYRWWARQFFGAAERSEMYRMVALGIRNGEKLSTVLRRLRDIEEHGGTAEPKFIVYDDAYEAIRSGEKTFDEALEDYIPVNEQMLVKAAMMSGGNEDDELSGAERKSRILRRAQQYAETQDEMTSMIYNKLWEPIMYMAAMAGLLWGIGEFMFPIMRDMSDPETWGPLGQVLRYISFYVRSILFPATIGLMVAVGVCIYATLNKNYNIPGYGDLRKTLDKIPPWSLYRLVTGSTFMRALSTMLQSNITLNQSLTTIEETANPWMRERVNRINFRVRDGEKNLGTAMRQSEYDFPDNEMIRKIEFMASYEGYEEELGDFSEIFLEDVKETVASQAGLIKGVTMIAILGLLIVIGGGMFSIVGSMLSGSGI